MDVSQLKQLVIVTGMSGAGKSVVIEALEDIGFFCIDNLPPSLFPKVIDMMHSPEYEMEHLALGIDVRSRDSFGQLIEEIKKVRQHDDIEFKLFFIDASDEKLVSRFKETRRAHPLKENMSLLESVREERKNTEELLVWASEIIDTTNVSPKELREKIRLHFIQEGISKFQVVLKSFGFKHGVPIDSDIMFDVRFLPNPHYIDELRPFTGMDQEIQDYVWQWDESNEFYEKLYELLSFAMPHFVKEGKSQLVISIGCTGGQHRSVAMVERLAKDLEEKFEYQLQLTHRDASIEGKLR